MPLDGEDDIRNPIIENYRFCNNKGKNDECLLLNNKEKRCDEKVCPKIARRIVSIHRDDAVAIFNDNSMIMQGSKEKNMEGIFSKLRLYIEVMMDLKKDSPPFLDVYVSFSNP